MRSVVVSFFCGLLFAAGLGLSGMTLPSKVIGFLDVTGAWDPSLALVMGGAVVVNALFFRFTHRRRAPFFHSHFGLPTSKDVDARLIAGAVIFGIGWGIGGVCPGPALTGLGSFSSPFLTFAGGLFIGLFAHALFERKTAPESSMHPPR